MKTNANCNYEVPAIEKCVFDCDSAKTGRGSSALASSTEKWVSDCDSVKTGMGSSGSILLVSSKY